MTNVQPIVFQVIQGFQEVRSKERGGKMFYDQRAWMHNGGAFPVEISWKLRLPIDAKPVGFYVPLPTAYQAGQYGSPELNDWELAYRLAPFEQSSVAPVSVSSGAQALAGVK